MRQQNAEFASRAISEYETFKNSTFWKLYLKKLKYIWDDAVQRTGDQLEPHYIYRAQGEKAGYERVQRLPETIIEDLKKYGIPDDDLVGPE